MHRLDLIPRLILWGCILWLVSAASGSMLRAEGTVVPRTVHNTCAGNCVVDQIFLHEGMGDAAAENAYYGWFDSYYELAGCGDPAWRTDLEFLLDLAAEFVDAPGGTTMQCWQGLAGQASVCGDDCAEAAVVDGRWAPQRARELGGGQPGRCHGAGGQLVQRGALRGFARVGAQRLQPAVHPQRLPAARFR